MKKVSILLLYSLSAFMFGVLSSCGEDELEEPAIYTPKQLKRLLLENDVKTWQQLSEYYLEDSCKLGHLLRFEDLPVANIDSAFFVYFFPDTSICDEVPDPPLFHRVKIKVSPIYDTTDSLLFIAPEGDTTIKTVQLITDQRLILNVAGEDGNIVATEEYRAVD